MHQKILGENYIEALVGKGQYLNAGA